MSVDDLVVAPILVLVAGVALQVLLARVLSGAGKGWLALGVTAASTVAVAALWPQVRDGAARDVRLGSWDGPVMLAFHVDGLAVLFALMATGIGAAILLYSVGYMARDAAATRFYVIMQVFITGLILLVFAADLLLMYAGWELVGLCSFLLVGFWYTDREAAAGARKVLVMTHGAGYALLAAILVLYARTGTTLWTDPRIGRAFTTGVFVLMLISATAKSVQFPLHTWIPSAMAAPTPVSALLHAAVYVKAGVYLVARMHSIAPWPHAWQASVVWLGTVTMLVGVLFAMVQHDAKRLLAFHTVSQIGYMMLGLGLGTPLGVAAALLHTLNHGLFKGGLFLGAGAVQHATGTRDMNRLGGLARRMPTTTAFWLVSSAAIAGVPLFNGFVSKWLLYVAALQSDYTVPALIAWIVSVLTMFSFMKASSAMFFGGDGEASGAAHESPRVMLVGSGILAAGCVILGVAPQLGLDYLVAPALTSMGLDAHLGVGWFGFTSGGAEFLLGGLGLAVLSVLLGYLGYRSLTRQVTPPVTAAQQVDWVPQPLVSVGPAAGALPPVGAGPRVTGSAGVFTGGEPVAPFGYPRAGDFSRPVATGLAPFFAWADPDRYYLAAWHMLLAVSGLAGRATRWLERRLVAGLAGGAMLIALVAGVLGTTVRTSVPEPGAAVPWPLVAAVGVALAGLLLTLSVTDGRSRHLWPAALTGAVALAGLCTTAELPRLVLLEGAAFLAVAVLARSGVPAAARTAYLAAAVLSAAALLLGTLLLRGGPAPLVLALLLTGFAVKFALVPAYVWLPATAERVPAALVGLIVSVVDLAGFVELADLRGTAPWLFEPRWPWLALALLSALGGAVLALAQRDVKRMLAFATITASGLLVLGVAASGRFGSQGAWALAAADALATALLFTAVAAAERDPAPLTLGSRGVARRHPLAAAGFLVGSLTVLGVPFTAGYPGHWRLYATALDVGRPALALLVVTTICWVLAFARVVATVWWGGSDDEVPVPHDQPPAVSPWSGEPPPHVVALAGLLLAVIVAGLVPAVLQDWGVR
ncbi:MAG TPA: proton-conducting transporter membrane subunit [Kineosporiaceae bacterium]|nr:proton-conducting transporter membrane subunit [Kineosporiaceae bacterium]